MWLAVAGAWAAAMLAINAIKFPFPFSAAMQGLAESGRVLLASFSWEEWRQAIADGPENIRAVAVFLLLQLSALALGRLGETWLTGRRARVRASDLENLLLGWLLAGLAAMGLGLAGLFRFFPMALLAILPIAANWRKLVRDRPAFPVSLNAGGILPRLGCWLSCLAAAPAAVGLLAPATGQENLGFYLTLPALWADSGKLMPQAADFFSTLPAPAHMLAGLGLVLGGEGAARLWPLMALLTGAGLSVVLAVRLAPAISGWAAFALLATCPFFNQLVWDGNPAVFAVPYALAAGIRVFSGASGEPRRASDAAWAGLMIGGVLCCQLPALVAAFLVPALFLLAGGRAPRFSSGMLYMLAAAAVAGPWLARSFLLTGDPIYPFGGAGFGIPDTAVRIYTLDAWPDAANAGLAGMEWIWLAALPLAFLSGKRAAGWWAAGILALALWFLLSPRHAGMVPAAVWLTAAALISAGDSISRLGKAPAGLIWLVAAVLLSQTARSMLDTVIRQGLPSGLGLESKAAHFARMCPALARAQEEVEASAPKGARVLVIGERRCYPRVRDFRTSSPYETPVLYDLVRASSTADELAGRIRQINVSYILHNHVMEIGSRRRQAAYAWTARDLSVWASYWRRHARLIRSPSKITAEEGGFHLYRLGAERRELNVAPTLPGIAGALAQIDALRDEGKLEEMAEQIRILDGIAGDFPEVKFFIGDFWAGQDPYKSWEYLRGAAAGGLRDIALWQDLAYQAEQRWRLEDALQYHENIAEISPRFPGERHRRVLLKLSRQSAKLSRPKRAEKYLRRAVAIFPKDAALWAELGEVYLSQDRRTAADWAFAKAVKLDPRNRDYRTALNRIRRQPR